MDGTKSSSETPEHISLKYDLVVGRSGRAEVGLKSPMDRPDSQILAVVTAKRGENPLRRKGKGFTATFVSRESADPKGTLT